MLLFNIATGVLALFFEQLFITPEDSNSKLIEIRNLKR